MRKNILTAIARRWLPRRFLVWVRRQCGMPAHHWEYVAPDWPEHDERAEGWSHPSVAAALLRNWPAYAEIVNGTEALGLWPLAPQVRDELAHNLMMTYGYVLARASHGRNTLSVLDWGGSIGHYALAAQRLLPEVLFDYTIKDLPEIGEMTAELLPSVSLVTTDAAAFARRYDLVLASNSLQYARDWRSLTDQLAKVAERWLFLTCIPVVRNNESFIIVQRPHIYGLATEYISWVFNRAELLQHFEGLGLTLVREFLAGGAIDAENAPETAHHEGFLFRRDGESRQPFSPHGGPMRSAAHDRG
jgi:putative methyltransferase (TIGR04325 family)